MTNEEYKAVLLSFEETRRLLYKKEIDAILNSQSQKTRLVQIAVAETNHGDLEAAVITENLNATQAWDYLERSFAAPHRIAIVEVRIPTRQTPIIQGTMKEAK